MNLQINVVSNKSSISMDCRKGANFLLYGTIIIQSMKPLEVINLKQGHQENSEASGKMGQMRPP